MNLTIDIGNTFVKAALFSNGAIIKSRTATIKELEPFIQNALYDFPVKHIILSSVINHPDQLIADLASNYEFIYLDHHIRLPFVNNYSTPETLGKDRLAVVAGAAAVFPDKNVLVIDAGTCIKYDFINAQKEYFGGAISPGITMRYGALNHFTQKLPLLSPLSEIPALIGDTTAASIHAGVHIGVLGEVKENIQLYMEKFKNISVILTGGDMNYFKPVMSGKNNIFADSLLIHKGLNHILEYNVDILQ